MITSTIQSDGDGHEPQRQGRHYHRRRQRHRQEPPGTGPSTCLSGVEFTGANCIAFSAGPVNYGCGSMGNESSSLPSSLFAAYGLDKSFPSIFMPGASALKEIPANALFEYLTEANQRTFFFLDILCQRGDQQARSNCLSFRTAQRSKMSTSIANVVELFTEASYRMACVPVTAKKR